MKKSSIRKVQLTIEITFISSKDIYEGDVIHLQFMTYDYINNWEKQIILLMIPNEEKEIRHYLEVKILSALLKRITSKHDGDFYWLNCLHFLEKKNKLKSQEKVCTNKDFCETVIPSQKDNIQKQPPEVFYEKRFS